MQAAYIMKANKIKKICLQPINLNKMKTQFQDPIFNIPKKYNNN